MRINEKSSELRLQTVGKSAKTLSVPVEEIIKEEEAN